MKRLAAGGMADVLLARTDGIAGFERHVVIKRIHAELLEEPRYVKMFLDEARLAASLHHHNVVQVNDIGEENGEYFFAMEYVHGEDARQLLVDASQRGEQIPLEHVVTIVMAAASGLHYAHEQRSMDGKPLHIVHRDVSPANILVGYDGGVKVADFGIALAAHRAEQTQSGVLKGKVAYMSPEQCNCDPVDRRSDVFSLGIVLYELVTVRPCFAGDNDFMTMSAIVGGKIEKPSSFRKDLPFELEHIIMKALAKNPADRYQSADELRMALEAFATAAQLRTSMTALADYMKKQFGAKALPWQEDDGEPEMTFAVPHEDIDTPAPEETDDDDDLSIPLAAPEEGKVRAPTLPMRALDNRPPAQIVVHTTPSSKRIDRRRMISEGKAAQARKSRKLWLAGSAIAVLIAAMSLIIVSTHSSNKTVPRASITKPETVHPRSSVPEPMTPSTVKSQAAAPAQTPAAAPEKKSRRGKTAPKPAKKWDPDALFPQ
ncbi:MAG TPA: serine/threonine-protein kinase [Kofleriaceae bacterium]|nr:serine/threonine-protein kinase [Kofleriaceae bacterium]